MAEALYPLRFQPIFKSAIWGGNTLRPLLRAAPTLEPTGEAWLISDQGESVSRVADGPLAGTSLRDLMRTRHRELMGAEAAPDGRFPLLLKLIDARQALSVQVHPNDEQAARIETEGLGKTEAWVVLRADSAGRIYAGLKSGVGAKEIQAALGKGMVSDLLHSFAPAAGDCIFLEAGTVHAIGAGVLLFEVQQTSDITYRLHDWDRVDAKTGRPRELHVDKALACVDFAAGPCVPVRPSPLPAGFGERLVSCRYFFMNRLRGPGPFQVGKAGECRIAVCIEGKGLCRHRGRDYPLEEGDALLLPACVGLCDCIPAGEMTILECGPMLGAA